MSERASVPSATPEAVLFQAFGFVEAGSSGMFRLAKREAPCACGGILVLEPDEALERVVTEHNATERHLAWRAWQATE